MDDLAIQCLVKSRRTFSFNLGSLPEIAHPGETGVGSFFPYRFQKPVQVSGIVAFKLAMVFTKAVSTFCFADLRFGAMA
ncbi:hypothetical protein CIT26_04710 [Mesorhizobium temperatum]|uniref:Uncharacterized protein n=1 Tax=Mesorhizobium temperatum TaxID=241416 RepID=A0A271LUZ7_9HYPH|nr:hypothetical protein CIT26_04710 [Mesorhizobium temperatum]